jgi:threonine 3-dehydrogenase
MGLFYRRKFGLDFRGVRYPSIVGPGVKTPGIVQYTSWVIEECAKGNPFTVWVKPESKLAVMYFKDAARAIVMLGEAPLKNIKMVNYVIAGATPIASAQELANMVKARIPAAKIDFKPDPELQKIVEKLSLSIDDSIARKEWNWKSEYDQERIVDDFLQEIKLHPQRYN